MKKPILLTTAAIAMALAGTSATAQTTQERIGAILGTLLGGRPATTPQTIEAQWNAGQTPLGNQRAQFETQIDTNVRTGSLNQTTAARLKSDYYALTQLETSYAGDRTFTAQERSDLTARYNALVQVLNTGNYPANMAMPTAEVSEGRLDFRKRVDAAVTARKVSRTQGTRLKLDYDAVIEVEKSYLSDGVLSDSEKLDLDERLDGLDVRLGDVAYGATSLTPRARLDAVLQAIPRSGLATATQTQLRIEQGDVARLEAAYARLTTTAEEKAYLERRIAELETRSGLRR